MAKARSRNQEWRALQNAIPPLLSRHGRHRRVDGDYWLVDQDSGTYQLKVLIYRNVVTLELGEAISELLQGYHGEWHVDFIEANPDGSEMTPPGGVRVSAGGICLLNPPEIPEAAWQRAQQLNDALSVLLSRHGTSSPYGHGDYWLVDDLWDTAEQKICVFRIEFLTPQLTSEIQGLLKEGFADCVVWCQMELTDPAIEVPPQGMRIFGDRLEHDWDRQRLRSDFGARFAW